MTKPDAIAERIESRRFRGAGGLRPSRIALYQDERRLLSDDFGDEFLAIVVVGARRVGDDDRFRLYGLSSTKA